MMWGERSSCLECDPAVNESARKHARTHSSGGELIASRQSRAEQAAAVLPFLQRHRVDLYRYCFAVTGTHEDAEDLTQAILLRALQHIETYEPTLGSPRIWLFAIAHNCAIGWRQAQRGQMTGQELVSTADPRAAQAFAAVELRLALDKLPFEMCEVVILYYYEGYTVGEIATTIGCRVGTVKWRLWRARWHLRQLLRDDDEANPGETAR